MDSGNGSHGDRSVLTAIAHRAMIERKLEPDFPAAAQRELEGIRSSAIAIAGVRDMSDRLWASIDNDDSRDLLTLRGTGGDVGPQQQPDREDHDEYPHRCLLYTSPSPRD